MQGLLLVDKPESWTSFDVVNYVRKLVAIVEGKKPKNIKVGHTGTLDPFATGLLILLIGKEYTRRAGELSKLDKTYELTMHLGQTSTTGDPEGKISHLSDHVPDIETIQAILAKFRGLISQTPPAYSAIKVNGQRAYELARQGRAVNIEPRLITVRTLELTRYSYPEINLTANVSSGTYIRTLVADIGGQLGVGAYTAVLKRTKINGYSLHQATSVESLSRDNIEDRLSEIG